MSLGLAMTRPSLRDGVFLYCYPGTSYLATIMLSLQDKIHSPAEALLKLTLMEARPYQSQRHRLVKSSNSGLLRRDPAIRPASRLQSKTTEKLPIRVIANVQLPQLTWNST